MATEKSPCSNRSYNSFLEDVFLSTRDRILRTALEVLTNTSYDSMTTAIVARHAGVSISTLYKFFPNKRSLTLSLHEHMLGICASRLEETCQMQHGKVLPAMVQALVSTYWLVNFERPDVAKVIDRPIDNIDKTVMLGAFNRRIEVATSAMLSTCPGVTFDALNVTSLTLLTALSGFVRGVIERDLPSTLHFDVHNELTRMCLAYLEAASAS